MFIANVATCLTLLGTAAPASVSGTDVDSRYWAEFVSALRAHEIGPQRIRPYYEALTGPLQQFLADFRRKADWPEWEARPEMHRVGSEIHYLLPLTLGGSRASYCFTLIEDAGTWFFRHVESITIRLDHLGRLPTSEFPDLPQAQKDWMREESYWFERVKAFKRSVAALGRDKALSEFDDGAGYFLQARTWVPFVDPARAFVLFLCWEQSQLRGAAVTLVSLADDRAEVDIEPVVLKLYYQTAQMRLLLSGEDYRAIFERIWRTRATAAGWDLAIQCDGPKCRFRMTTKTP